MNDLTVIFPEGKKLGKTNKPIRVLDIDLGTTNSTIAEIKWSPGKHSPVVVRCIEVEQNTLDGQYTHLLVPSVVALYGGKVYVGEGAKRLRAQHRNLVLSKIRIFSMSAKTTWEFSGPIIWHLTDLDRLRT